MSEGIEVHPALVEVVLVGSTYIDAQERLIVDDTDAVAAFRGTWGVLKQLIKATHSNQGEEQREKEIGVGGFGGRGAGRAGGRHPHSTAPHAYVWANWYTSDPDTLVFDIRPSRC